MVEFCNAGEECVAAGGGLVVGGERGARFLIRGLFHTVRSINPCCFLHASSSSPLIKSQT